MNSEVRTPPPAATAEPAAKTETVATPSAPVLITEQEVMFGSTAAGTLPADPRSRWIVALRRVFSRPDWHVDERRPAGSQQSYLENSRMSREMRRL
jgi:hypothetical protein